MGQKVNPISFRLGYNKTWDSRWFAEKEYSTLLLEDVRMRRHITGRLSFAGVGKVEIERAADKVRVKIHSARPGVIIGRGGSEIDRLKEDLQDMTGKEVHLDIIEIKKPQTHAQLVSETIALQLEKRIAFRKAMKKAITYAMSEGAQGIKIRCGGRLGGAEIARSESYKEGKIPLHTIKADIDYGFSEANTTYGKIGVKVWVYHGDAGVEAVRARETPRQKMPGRRQGA